MPNFANITLIGHCGRDIELKYGQSGTAFASTSLAVNVGKKEDPPSWYKVTFFGKQAELANEYLKKGSAVLVHGQPRISEWTNKEGVKQTTVEVNVREMTFLGGKSEPAATSDLPPGVTPVNNDDSSDLPF